ncbi:hypothetical protein BDV12DRAFT_193566 [Aspergillus spectabilis]
MATFELKTADPRLLGRKSFDSPPLYSAPHPLYTAGRVYDGIPTKEASKYKLHSRSPDVRDRLEPRSKALDLVRSWRSELDLLSHVIDTDVLKAYQDTRLGSKELRLRLLELAAVIIHIIAALLFDHTTKPAYKCPPLKRRIDTQIDQVITFGLYGEPTVPSQFPLKAEHHAVRLFAKFTMQQNIYRSRNDRRVPEVEIGGWNMNGRMEDDPHAMEIIRKYHDGQLGNDLNKVYP